MELFFYLFVCFFVYCLLYNFNKCKFNCGILPKNVLICTKMCVEITWMRMRSENAAYTQKTYPLDICPNSMSPVVTIVTIVQISILTKLFSTMARAACQCSSYDAERGNWRTSSFKTFLPVHHKADNKPPHLVGCGTCCIVRCCTHVVLRKLLFFPALSFNPSEESGWEEKRQRATEDGSLAVSLRGPYEISSHVLHHAHYIWLSFVSPYLSPSCSVTFVSLKWWHCFLFVFRFAKLLVLYKTPQSVQTKNKEIKTQL